METFLGTLLLFAGNFVIKGYAYCNGQLLSISQNTALFSLIGTIYGGDGQTSFGLPDLRGRTAIGFGQGPGLPNYVVGQVGGTPSVTLLLTNMPSHTHPADASTLAATPSASTAAGTTNIPGPTLVPAMLPTIGSGPSSVAVNGYAAMDKTTTLAPSSMSGTITIGPAGGNQPFSTMPPYLAMNYLIALEGVFPSRS